VEKVAELGVHLPHPILLQFRFLLLDGRRHQRFPFARRVEPVEQMPVRLWFAA
jgi:hypothetical protein